MTTSCNRPLRADAERNRRLILDAAGEVFAEHGLAASFDEVARRAGVGVGTVYRRFPDRDDLIDALFVERIDAMVGLASRAVELPDAWEALVTFLEGTIDAQARDRGLKEVLGDGQRGHERLEAARRRMTPAIERLVVRARAEGALRPDVESVDLVVVAGMLAQVSPAASPELWRRYFPLVVEGLRASPEQRERLPLRSPTEVEVLAGPWRG